MPIIIKKNVKNTTYPWKKNSLLFDTSVGLIFKTWKNFRQKKNENASNNYS